LTAALCPTKGFHRRFPIREIGGEISHDNLNTPAATRIGKAPLKVGKNGG